MGQNHSPGESVPDMHLIRCRLVAFGFVWIALWALMGSLMGYRLQEEIVAGGSPWLTSLTRDLLRSTHAHMNSMALLCIITGVALPLVARTLSARALALAASALPASIVVFGAGMLWEALSPPGPGAPAAGGSLAALGGSVFILVTIFFGIAAWRAGRTPS